MGVECAVATCHIKRTPQSKLSGITFHLFPKDANVREKWRSKMRRKGDWVPKDWDVVCSVHFRHADFDCTGQTVRLQRGAVPSLFPKRPQHLLTMPRHCSVGGCRSRDNRETRKAGVTFHRLPKGASRRHLWINNSHRSASWDPQTDFVYFCSKHFTAQSFELTGCSGVRRLKEDAFPTVFEPSTGTKRRTAAPREGGGASIRGSSPSDEGVAAPRGGATHEESSQSQPSSEQQQVSDPPGSRPPSPSRYMRRLPPPAGFYLPREHSYALLCPQLWRKRYDTVVDCLENVLRQLHAARRRESRLRRSLLRLRDKHVRVTSQHGTNKKGGGTNSQLHKGQPDALSPSGLLEDTAGGPMEGGGTLCYNCGKGQTHSDGDGQLSEGEEPEIWRCGSIQRVSVRPPPDVITSSLQSHRAGGPPPSPGSPCGADEEEEMKTLLCIDDSSTGHLLLLPVHPENLHRTHMTPEDLPPILVSEEDWKPPEQEAIADLHLLRSSSSRASEEQRDALRERLKEHLEGFHLQLSSEFTP